MTSKEDLKLRLLAPKHLTEFESSDWMEYVESLYQRPKPPKNWNFRRNDKGTPIITIRNRKPKFLMPEEFAELLEEAGMSEDELRNFLKEKKVEVKK